MRHLSLLAVSCLVLACGEVTSINPDGGGTGGSSGSGGSVGSGGSHGSGGSVGSGGSTGSGGNVGSGGSAGSGGASGSGGSAGSGGSIGSGGSHMDAAVDSPADSGGDTCLKLREDYDAAWKQAKVCNPLVKSLQCQATASPSLQCPGCVSHVQSTTTLDQIRAKWEMAGCHSGICPQIACVFPGSGACMPSADNTSGTCIDVYTATTN